MAFILANRLYLIDEDLGVTTYNMPANLRLLDSVAETIYFQNYIDYSFVKFEYGEFTNLGTPIEEEFKSTRKTAIYYDWADHSIIAGRVIENNGSDFKLTYYEYHVESNEVRYVEDFSSSLDSSDWITTLLRQTLRLMGKQYPHKEFISTMTSY